MEEKRKSGGSKIGGDFGRSCSAQSDSWGKDFFLHLLTISVGLVDRGGN